MVIMEKTMGKKKTLGRQRIEIKKLDKKSNKQVTFSKRRAGLFKKAGELSVLCGVDVAVIVFSPNDKVFCFGHPNVDTVLDQFLTRNHPSPSKTIEKSERVVEEHVEALTVLEMEKKRLVEVKENVKITRNNNGGFWWDEPIENLGMEELKQFRAGLLELRAKVAERAQRMMMMRMEGSLLPPLPPSSFHPPGTFAGLENSFASPSSGGGCDVFGFGSF